MNLVLNEATKIEFSLAVAGTQMKPSEVRVVLGTGPKLTFIANTEDGINYSAIVTPLREVVSSICLFTVEVLFGEKIFVPIRRQITLADHNVSIQVFDKDTECQCSAEEIPTQPEVVQNIELENEPEIVAQIEQDENKPIEVKPVEEEIKIDPIIDQKEFNNQLLKIFETTHSTVQKINQQKETFIAPAKNPFASKKQKQKLVPLPKLVESKPKGIEVDSIKVAKSILSEKPIETIEIKPIVKPKKQKVTETVIPFKIEKTEVFFQ